MSAPFLRGKHHEECKPPDREPRGTGDRNGDRARRAGPAAQHRLDHRRGHGPGAGQLRRPSGPHAEHGSPRARGRPLHPMLYSRPRLHPVPIRVNHRPLSDKHRHASHAFEAPETAADVHVVPPRRRIPRLLADQDPLRQAGFQLRHAPRFVRRRDRLDEGRPPPSLLRIFQHHHIPREPDSTVAGGDGEGPGPRAGLGAATTLRRSASPGIIRIPPSSAATWRTITTW